MTNPDRTIEDKPPIPWEELEALGWTGEREVTGETILPGNGITSNVYSPLVFAISKKCFAAIPPLVLNGALNIPYPEGSYLQDMIGFGPISDDDDERIILARLMIEQGAPIDEYDKKLGFGVVHNSIRLNQLPAVKMLLAHGADLTAKDFYGEDTIDVALDNQRWAMANIILDYGYKIEHPKILLISSLRSAFEQMSFYETSFDHQEISEYLRFLERICELDKNICCEKNILKYATDVHTFDFLIHHGASLDDIDEDGKNLMDVLHSENDLNLIRSEDELSNIIEYIQSLQDKKALQEALVGQQTNETKKIFKI
jgi:hypothetical protein